MKLIELSIDAPIHLVEKMLDYENFDIDLFKYFIGMAFPAMAQLGDIQLIMEMSTLSRKTSAVEEKLSHLVFENSF